MPVRRFLPTAIAITSLCFLGQFRPSPEQEARGGWLVAQALADDDDDDGGGGTRAGGRNKQDGVSYKVPKSRKRTAARKKRPATAASAPRELVAWNVSVDLLPRIEQLDYRVVGRHAMNASENLVLRLRLPRGKGLTAAKTEIAALAPGIAADQNHIYRLQDAKACGGGDCAQFTLVGWGEPDQTCGARLRIGMIDTPVNASHPVLDGLDIENLSLLDGRERAADGGHGTAIAALLIGSPASDTPGLVPGASLVAVNIFRRQPGNQGLADAFDLIGALELLRARGVKVINMSLAGPPNDGLEQAVAAAVSAGTVIVAAAGNDGPRAKPLYPAAYDGVIAVTAVDFRNRVYRRAGQGDHIDIAAPGVNIWSASHQSGSRLFTGSSFATPFVTAAAALLASARGRADVAEIERQLAAAARDLGRLGRDPVFGAGLVQRPACR